MSVRVLTLPTLGKQPGVESENVSYSRGLVAILVLTLIGVKYNLGFRRNVFGLLSWFIKLWNAVERILWIC